MHAPIMSEIAAGRSQPLTSATVISGLIRSLRIRQWSKNSVVFAALIFALELFDPASVLRAFQAFGVFCVLASGVYLLNDVFDLPNDRVHPTKRLRPVAAGEVPVALAALFGAALALGGIAMAWVMAPGFGAVAVTYIVSNLLYSAWLKKIVIVDVMVISMGFVLRAVAGGIAIEVEVSEWLILCTILLSLFLALCKRRQELALLEHAVQHRTILKEYSVEMVDQMITIVTAATLIAYFSYTLSPEVHAKLHTGNLYLTVPFVIYGLFRYLYLVHRREMGGSPTEALFSDLPLLLNIVLWAAAAVAILYAS